VPHVSKAVGERRAGLVGVGLDAGRFPPPAPRLGGPPVEDRWLLRRGPPDPWPDGRPLPRPGWLAVTGRDICLLRSLSDWVRPVPVGGLAIFWWVLDSFGGM
jgi:hypothetical protein